MIKKAGSSLSETKKPSPAGLGFFVQRSMPNA